MIHYVFVTISDYSTHIINQLVFILDTDSLYCEHILSLLWTQTLFIVDTDSLYCGHILSLLWTNTLL